LFSIFFLYSHVYHLHVLTSTSIEIYPFSLCVIFVQENYTPYIKERREYITDKGGLFMTCACSKTWEYIHQKFQVCVGWKSIPPQWQCKKEKYADPTSVSSGSKQTQ
jgi:hypothetical protein